jgi:hypothetical protein
MMPRMRHLPEVVFPQARIGRTLWRAKVAHAWCEGRVRGNRGGDIRVPR